MPQHTCQCLRLSGHSGPHPRDIESRSQSPDRSWRTGPSSSHWGHWDPRRSLQPRHRPRYWAFVELRQVRVRGCPGSTCSFLDDQSPSLLTIDCSGLANSPVTWHTTLSIFDICTGPGVSQSRKSRRSGRFRSFLRSASARVRAGAAHARPAQAAEYATSHSHSGVLKQDLHERSRREKLAAEPPTDFAIKCLRSVFTLGGVTPRSASSGETSLHQLTENFSRES